MVYLLYIVSWAGFYFFHSCLASSSMKSIAEKASVHMGRAYRLLYNLFSISTLSLLIYWMFFLSNDPVFHISTLLKYLGGAVLISGIALLIISIYNYNLGDFSGLNQLKSGQDSTGEHSQLNITGLNRFVRHPLYLALVLIFMSAPLFHFTWPVILAVAVSFMYLPFGIWSEEKKLIHHFGDEYVEYRKKVPALFPWK